MIILLSLLTLAACSLALAWLWARAWERQLNDRRKESYHGYE